MCSDCGGSSLPSAMFIGRRSDEVRTRVSPFLSFLAPRADLTVVYHRMEKVLSGASGSAGYHVLRVGLALRLINMVFFFLLYFFFFFREKLPVHVVVDPILSKVLRPHQREVNEG